MIDPSSAIDFYPRLSLRWPILACTIPPTQSTSSSNSNLQLYKLTRLLRGASDSSAIEQAELLPNPDVTVLDKSNYSNVWCCLALSRTNSTAHSASLQLTTGSTTGLVCQWDLTAGKLINKIDAMRSGDLLRCIALPSSLSEFVHNHQCLLTGSTRGIIGLWDMRISGLCRPQQTFSHSGQAHSASDLLWLTDTQFASTSDTVDRNLCDPNLSVWDTRFGKPISHQLYQERWGCSRLARKSMSGSLGFAVQTHGNGIVEVTGSSYTSSHTCSNDIKYRLERRWRYEGHDCQAHPLGLAYSTCASFLASGNFGSDCPTVWYAKRTHSHKPGDSLKGVNFPPASYRSPRLTLTDVVWLPHHVTRETGCVNQLIGIQSTGTLRIYQLHSE